MSKDKHLLTDLACGLVESLEADGKLLPDCLPPVEQICAERSGAIIVGGVPRPAKSLLLPLGMVVGR